MSWCPIEATVCVDLVSDADKICMLSWCILSWSDPARCHRACDQELTLRTVSINGGDKVTREIVTCKMIKEKSCLLP